MLDADTSHNRCLQRRVSRLSIQGRIVIKCSVSDSWFQPRRPLPRLLSGLFMCIYFDFCKVNMLMCPSDNPAPTTVWTAGLSLSPWTHRGFLLEGGLSEVSPWRWGVPGGGGGSDETTALFRGTQLKSSGGDWQTVTRRNTQEPVRGFGERGSTRSSSSVLEWDKEQMFDSLKMVCIPRRSVPSFIHFSTRPEVKLFEMTPSCLGMVRFFVHRSMKGASQLRIKNTISSTSPDFSPVA